MRFSTIVAVLALSAASLAARADAVTYTLSGNFSGSLGATTFTDTAATFSFVANIRSPVPGSSSAPFRIDDEPPTENLSI